MVQLFEHVLANAPREFLLSSVISSLRLMQYNLSAPLPARGRPTELERHFRLRLSNPPNPSVYALSLPTSRSIA
jgi:hypothetical protein